MHPSPIIESDEERVGFLSVVAEGHVMPTFQSSTVLRAKSLATTCFEKSEVVSTFDKKGNLSHLEARLSVQEFYQLYPAGTQATVYLKGHWLQFSVSQRDCVITNRHMGVSLYLRIECSNWNPPKLVFRNEAGRVVLSRTIKKLTADELSHSSLGLELAAQGAVRAFDRLGMSPLAFFHEKPLENLPSIHVVPCEKTTTQQTGSAKEQAEFSSDNVLLQ